MTEKFWFTVEHPEDTTVKEDRNSLFGTVVYNPRVDKIAAIKAYRNLTGAGLKSAKDAVERAMQGRMIWAVVDKNCLWLRYSINRLRINGFKVFKKSDDQPAKNPTDPSIEARLDNIDDQIGGINKRLEEIRERCDDQPLWYDVYNTNDQLLCRFSPNFSKAAHLFARERGFTVKAAYE